MVRTAGSLTADSTVEFCSACVPNVHTRSAYGRAVRELCAWCEDCPVTLGQLSAPVVATYFQEVALRVSASSANLHLSAVRQWLDWLTVRGALPFNPALSARGAKVLRSRESRCGGRLSRLRDPQMWSVCGTERCFPSCSTGFCEPVLSFR